MRAFVFAVSLIAAANVAHADWQYTKWGMHPAEAQRASGGHLQSPQPAEAARKSVQGVPPALVGQHVAGAFRFDVALYFGGSGQTLDHVQLNLVNREQHRAVIEELRGTYGEPVEFRRTSVGDICRWRDDRRNLSITAMPFEDRVAISYTPLRGRGAGGL